MADAGDTILVVEDLIKEFCEITQCSQEVGRLLIKRNNFILQNALNEFFEKGHFESESEKVSEEVENPMAESLIAKRVPESASSEGKDSSFKLLTWNIDGLDERDLKLRTLAVAFQINSLKPEAVYLQEVVPETLELIQRMCKGYTIHHHIRASYFCAVLVKKTAALQFVSKNVIEYPGSIMGRYLLCVSIKYHGHPMRLMTTHLESTKDAERQRKAQLVRCFLEIEKLKCHDTTILAGDLNIRDHEIESIEGLPVGVQDAWIETGSDWSTKFTWDVGENDNLNWQYKNKPKLRFDRILYKSDANQKFHPQSFKLIGKDRLESCGRFASDHWGIFCQFLTTT